MSAIAQTLNELLLYTPVYMIYPPLMLFDSEIVIATAIDIVEDKLEAIVVDEESLPFVTECVIIPAKTIKKEILDCDHVCILRITDYDNAELTDFNGLLMSDGVAVIGMVNQLDLSLYKDVDAKGQEEGFEYLVKIIENMTDDTKCNIDDIFISIGYKLGLKTTIDWDSVDEESMQIPKKVSDSLLAITQKLNK